MISVSLLIINNDGKTISHEALKRSIKSLHSRAAALRYMIFSIAPTSRQKLQEEG